MMGENKDFNEELPKKIKLICRFVWYVIKSPFVFIIEIITNAGESLKSLRRPKVWINLWIITLTVYMIWYWQKIKGVHLFFWFLSFTVIVLWYLWVRGDWRSEIR